MGPMRHAVVIGASIGGLCAAKVLAEFADQVTVFERDELPAEPASRSATPQDRHVHLLMARGAEELESLFPGLLADMVADGVPILENRPDCIHFGAAGHVLGTQHRLQDEFTAYVPSRPHLEWQIRSRVTALPNVTLQRRGVDEPALELAPGDTAQLPDGLGTVTFENESPAGAEGYEESVKRFVSLSIHRDVGAPWVLAFAVLATLGLLAGLFVPRRRMWVTATARDGSVDLEYAGLARGEDPTLAAAVDKLAASHEAAVRERVSAERTDAAASTPDTPKVD